MNRKTKFLIVAWLIFSWALLIVFSLKPIGAVNTIKSILGPLIVKINAPREIALCDFEDSRDFLKWRWFNSFAEPSKEHVARGSYSAKIVYSAKEGVPSLVCEDYNLGALQLKDWSDFQRFGFYVFNPREAGLALRLKIKDAAGRHIDKEIILGSGENKIIFDLEDIGQSIDLGNVVYLNFYLIGPQEDTVIYLDDIRLERGSLNRQGVLSRPAVNFLKLACPEEAKRGSVFLLSAYISATENLKRDFRVFIHITYAQDIKKESSRRRWYINADRDPWVPTSQWVANTPYEIGPVNVYVPRDFPPGEYIIQIGLFNAASRGSHYNYSSSRGMMDFRASFPRLRYANTEIKDYIVGRIRVLD